LKNTKIFLQKFNKITFLFENFLHFSNQFLPANKQTLTLGNVLVAVGGAEVGPVHGTPVPRGGQVLPVVVGVLVEAGLVSGWVE
jgi:hypothetical protein